MDKTKTKKDSPGKSPILKPEKIVNGKKNSEKKNGDQNPKKFEIISSESISTIAESIGLSDVPEEARSILSEDVSYKLREIVSNCAILLHNNKRRKLLTEDVNRVLLAADCPMVYGHSFLGSVDFIHVPKAEVFVENDAEIDIVAMSCLLTPIVKLGEEYVKGAWLLPDPADKAEPVPAPVVKDEPSSSTTTPPRPTQRLEEQHTQSKPPPHFINYYLQVARVVIGGSEPHLRVALADLRTNSKVGPLVPYFLNLVALSVNKLQRNGRLTDALLRTVEALVDNPYVDPSSQLAVNRAVNALLVVAIEPKAAKNCDDLLLRKRAATLLAKVLVCWSIELKQQMDIVRQLLQLLLDSSISLKSHYGAVMCLTALGQRTLDSFFWPILDRYIAVLEDHKTSPADAQDVQFVKGAIMVAVERMYRRGRSHLKGEDINRRLKVEQRLYEFLGDALTPRYNLKSPGPAFPGTQVVLCDSDKRDQHQFTDVDLRIRESLLKTSTQSLFSYQPETRGMMPKLHMYSVFSLSPCAFRQPKEIVFNFIGSNQKHPSLLKRRKIGELLQKDFKSNHYRFAQKWRQQNILRKTRSMKYCSPSHNKSGVGDLFGFL